MTVNILIQIDKLVQLLESPVFTCSSSHGYHSEGTANASRPPAAIARTGQIPSPVQMPLRAADAPATVIRLRRAQEPTEQRQLDRVLAHRTKTVCFRQYASSTLSARVCGGGMPISSTPFPSLLLQVPSFQSRYSLCPSQCGDDAQRLILRPAQSAQGSRGGHHPVGRAAREVPQRPGAGQEGAEAGRRPR